MAVGDVLGDLGRHAADQDAGSGFDHGYAGAAGDGARRHLEPDETAADEGDALARPEARAERQRVAIVAEVAERVARPESASRRGTAPVASSSRS